MDVFQPQNHNLGRQEVDRHRFLQLIGRRRRCALGRRADGSVALWFGEAGQAGGEGRHFEFDLVALRVTRQRAGRRSADLRREEVELGGLGGLQGSVGGSPPLLPLSFFLFPWSLSSLGHVVCGDLGSGGGGAGGGWRRSLERHWFLVVLAGGVKYL